MTRYEITVHAGPRIALPHRLETAIKIATAEARRTGQRINIYPRPTSTGPAGTRICSCYPNAVLWEADLAGLEHAEYMARHAAAAKEAV